MLSRNNLTNFYFITSSGTPPTNTPPGTTTRHHSTQQARLDINHLSTILYKWCCPQYMEHLQRRYLTFCSDTLKQAISTYHPWKVLQFYIPTHSPAPTGASYCESIKSALLLQPKCYQDVMIWEACCRLLCQLRTTIHRYSRLLHL